MRVWRSICAKIYIYFMFNNISYIIFARIYLAKKKVNYFFIIVLYLEETQQLLETVSTLH